MGRRSHVGLGVLVASALLSACENSDSRFGPGLHLGLRVRGGQLQRGSMGMDEGGPAVSQVLQPQVEVERGSSSAVLRGRLAPGGVALHVQAVGDDDHWVIGAKGFDFVVADELQFSAPLEFSYAIQTEELLVRLQAADAAGRLGPMVETRFFMVERVPSARLLVSLGWDAPVDLDLHLRDGDGVVVGSKNLNSYEPPNGTVPPADAWMSGGFLDFDSNQHCELDLRNQENILWLQEEPPSGHYEVFAHLFSPCDQAAVTMIATAHWNGELLRSAVGTLYEFDSRTHPGPDDAPGLLLLEFDLP